MNREQAKDQFQKWQDVWDKAAVEFAKQTESELKSAGMLPKEEQPPTSWLTGLPLDRDYGDKGDNASVEPDWADIYARSQDLHGLDDGLLTDHVKYHTGETKPKVNFGGFTPTKTNPTRQDSTGPDAGDGVGVRVTSNWSDGPDLRELDDIKRRLEEMERKYHTEEVTKGSSSLKKELASLREKVNKLSEKINREPEVDVT